LVKPISNLIIRDEQDIHDALTNREKLEYLLQEYEKNYQLDRKGKEVCCDENTPCVPNENNNSNEKKMMNVDTGNYNNDYIDLHKGKNGHSKNNTEEDDGLNIEYMKPNLKSKFLFSTLVQTVSSFVIYNAILLRYTICSS
jgi:hypothetical protein